MLATRRIVNLPTDQVYESQYLPVQTDDNYEKTYIKQLKKFAKYEIKQAKQEQKIEGKSRRKELNLYQGKWLRRLSFMWKHTVGRLGEDWVFLAFLGFIMALISYGIDKLVLLFSSSRMYLYKLGYNMSSRYFGWILLPFCLIMFNVGFVYMVGPQSAGSGLPELKTILRGVVLKEYLTFRVLIAKIFGIACTIGSGMPLGKEGPLVHMSSIVTTLYANFLSKMKHFKGEEIRKTEMLAAACAVGVATTFAAPIGGVLFSIEVTTSYFAVRNYFRGFFAAVCGAITYRLLAVWIDGMKTYTPVFKTNFLVELPFDPQELIAFALIGVVSGFGGALYCWCHRNYVLFTKRNKFLIWLNSFCRFLYPGFVVLTVSSITFPPGIGRYLAGHLPPKGHVDNLFANFTWMAGNLSDSQEMILNNWRTDRTGPYLHLLSFMGYMFLMSIFASTMPVPNGTFIPTFRFGAAFGRIIGEIMARWYPDGFFYGGRNVHVIPGGYATVGAAAFTGAVTQTVSVAVIVFEMTGQICHAIPILIAVLIAVGISTKLGPSCYNNVIIIKKLPYLPDLLPSVSKMYTVCVEDFMVTDVKYVHFEMTYAELEGVLKDNPKLKTFPIVENADNMVLLGSTKRNELIKLLEEQTGRKKRLEHIFQKVFQESQESVAPEDKGSDATVELNNRLSVYDNQLLRHSVSTPGIFEGESYLTVDGTMVEEDERLEKRKEKAFRSIFRRVPKNQGSFRSLLGSSRGSSIIPAKGKTVMLRHPIKDMSKTERKKWELIQMACLVDFSNCFLDPAPFQLVERTSLLKVHSLFSLMGLNQAYVTAIGRLVGVVGLKELRKAIEDANSGILRPSEMLMHSSYLGMKDSSFQAYV
ncbi:chloride channel protein 2-like [Coccinella septempunctata]|uniref:chloride channel protein 2-like n=1 Tax=Coccinella septempunctata TaxID=41139 RepID=UPI001D0782FD|nr:chloride channel protein 2-like [Coccinella septempunctata]